MIDLDNVPPGKVARYGYPPLYISPLDYQPDMDVCTDAEIGAWQEACVRVRAGLVHDSPGIEVFSGELGATGRVLIGYSGSKWGMGTWLDDFDPMMDGVRW